MTRWTSIALALMLPACNKGERNQTAQNKSDSAAAAAEAAPESTASADSTRARTMSADTTTAKPLGGEKATTKAAATPKPAATGKTEAPSTGAAKDNGPTGAEAMTGVRAGVGAPPELSADQVKQLQSALKKAGCYSGRADGVSGAGTQRAIACGIKKYKLAADDTNGLYRKLGLKF
jgi:Putative peptidoglycan binding domain